MNISSISFCGSSNNTRRTSSSSRTSAAYNGTYSQNAHIQREDMRKKAGFDTFEPSSVQKSKKKSHKQKLNPYKALVLGYAAFRVMQMLSGPMIEPDATIDTKVKAGEDLNSYAAVYDIDVNSLMAYNELDNSVIPYDMKITIPSSYEHPIIGKMNELQQELYSNKLDEAERDEVEDELANLAQIQQIQSEIATTCTDGDYVYFTITLPRDESATEIQKGYRGSINVEEFKNIFGIKDGVLKEHNNISFTWGSDEYGDYMDWTTARLDNGETIKIPLSAISMKQVNVQTEG